MDALAAVLALLAAANFALASTLWQKAALNLTGVSLRHPGSFLTLLTQWIWLAGLGAQTVGVLLQAVALDIGRVSMIQPLLVTTVVWALPLGHYLTHQSVGRREIIGAVTCVGGLVLYAVFADPAEGVESAPFSDWAMAMLVLGAACVALLLFANRGTLSMRAAVLGTVAGILYGLSATLLKPVTTTLDADGFVAVLETWELWVMAAAGIAGFVFQQLSLATGRLVPSVAAVSVANPIVSVMLGALVLQETIDKDPTWHAVVGIGGLALALLGAVIVSSGREEEPDEPPAVGAGVAAPT